MMTLCFSGEIWDVTVKTSHLFSSQSVPILGTPPSKKSFR